MMANANHQSGVDHSLSPTPQQHRVLCSISSASSSGNGETPLAQNEYPAARVVNAFVSAASASALSSASAASANADSSKYSFGLDEMLLARADSTRQQQKAFSSRAHRKLMSTLYRALRGHQSWRAVSLSYVAALICMLAYGCFLFGCYQEISFRRRHSLEEQILDSQVLVFCDQALLAGAVLFFVSHLLWYFEVINSCNNLEVWLDEYFYGSKPLIRPQWCGFFPTHIEFWVASLALVGSLLFAFARLFILLETPQDQYDNQVLLKPRDFGLLHVNHLEMMVLVWYWLPFCLGSFLLLVGAYLGYVEVVHGWTTWHVSCKCPSLECWITILNLLASGGIFMTSTLQFMDPSAELFDFQLCLVPFMVGCACGLLSSSMSIVELEKLHRAKAHPDFGVIQRAMHTATQYGT